MNTTLIKEELLNLRKNIPFIEQELEEKISSVQTQIDGFNELDNEAQALIANGNKRVRLNIGGKRFDTSVAVLLSQKDTFFYKLILSKKYNLDEEIFIDRNPRLFQVIIDYLRNKTFNISDYKKHDHFELYLEASFYNIPEISSAIKGKKGKNIRKQELQYIGFEFYKPYYSGSLLAGTNNMEDLSDETCSKGICSDSPGWIIIEFNDIYSFDEIEVGGWNGNSSIWSPSNGAGASIEVSNDMNIWEKVGNLPSTYSGSRSSVILHKICSAKYIKFNHNSYLGIGYLKIITHEE
jgi:hypothetical protein